MDATEARGWASRLAASRWGETGGTRELSGAREKDASAMKLFSRPDCVRVRDQSKESRRSQQGGRACLLVAFVDLADEGRSGLPQFGIESTSSRASLCRSSDTALELCESRKPVRRTVVDNVSLTNKTTRLA